jgi:hypothetical protein
MNLYECITAKKMAAKDNYPVDVIESLIKIMARNYDGRRPNHHWKHLHPNSADKVLRKSFDRVSIEGAPTHSFRRTALTFREQRRHSAADYSRNQWSQQPRTIAAQRKR